MAFIKITEPEQAEGKLKEIYEELSRSRGKIAEVHKIQSLNPDSIIKHMELYMCIMFGKSPLRRVQREMIGVVVSKANNCEYCQVHHAEAVNHYWKNEKRTMALRQDFRKAELNKKDLLLCEYADYLTRYPGKANEEKFAEKLIAAGFDDRAVLDATLIISYFNFVNRMVLGLGVNLETDPGGYNYD